MAEPTHGGAEYQRVAEGLRRHVLTSGLRVGDEMPSLQDVMDEYSVSVMVARRALMELRINGVIQTRQGKRAVVVDPAAARGQSEDVAELMRLFDGLQDEVRQQGQEMASMRREIAELQGRIAERPVSGDSPRPAP